VIRWLSDAKMSEVDMMKEVNQLTDLLTEAVLISTSQDGSGVKGYDLFERMGGDAARGK